MATDLGELTRLCIALDVLDDEVRSGTAWLELVCEEAPSAATTKELETIELMIRDHPLVTNAWAALDAVVRVDPQQAFDLVVAEMQRIDMGYSSFVTDFSAVLLGLAAIDAEWLQTVIGLVGVEAEMWSSMRGAFGRPLGRLLLDRLGVEGLARAWLQHAAARARDESMWWAWQIVDDIEAWSDEVTHRDLLVALVDLADDETVWDVAAGPLEDFCADRDGRLDWITHQARIDPRFRRALGGVWTHGKDPVTNARIRAIAPRV
jgi:hypothetical protein